MIDRLMVRGRLEQKEISELLRFRKPETVEYLFEKARMVRAGNRRKAAEIWGRIPVSSYCKYNCKMCGLRRDNQFAKRYRMDEKTVLSCCMQYYRQGVRGFYLESGDDIALSEKNMAQLLLGIAERLENVKVVLAMGEKPLSAYAHWKQIGADGYVLYHGCANEQQFKKIYPSNMSPLLRKQCLWGLKEYGYQAGTGFLVGLPYQTMDDVAADICFIREFCPSIIDVGAFVPALHTPFERERSGNGEVVLQIIAIFRIMFPEAHIIADPTLDRVMQNGRFRALDAGADVLLVDALEGGWLEQYQVYERRTGRLSAPVDNVEQCREQLRMRGLSL